MKALIVDDSEFQRTELKDLLIQEGFECHEAEDGLAAMAQIENNDDYRFIVTDLNMPRMNGLEFASQARANPNYKNVPIFMLTTDVTADSKAKGKNVGLTAWIIKPLKPEAFLKTLKIVLQR